MHKALQPLALACALFLCGPAALADQRQYTAPLLGSSEVPGVVTTGFGTSMVTLDTDLLTMRVQASFQDLIGTVTAAHIHCCTLPGANVGVASQTPSFSGFPTGGTSGTYDATFDMTLASSYSAAFITNNGGTPGTAFAALMGGMDGGMSYLNIHTTRNPGGEIRGLLAPVPEPATYALMLGGLAALGAVARRRRQP